jgi:non-homologous end joining protein Ku
MSFGLVSGAWEPSGYLDTYTDRANEFIDAKRDSRESRLSEEAPAAPSATELTEALV